MTVSRMGRVTRTPLKPETAPARHDAPAVRGRKGFQFKTDLATSKRLPVSRYARQPAY